MRAENSAGSDEVALRRATARDIPSIHGIELQSYTVPWNRTTFHNLLDRADTDIIVAHSGDRIVGYAITWFVIDQGELGNVAVDEGWRRQGIARALVSAALDLARTRGISEIYLEVRRSNVGAQRLYRRLGFRQVGIRRNYYVKPAEDALVMRRTLRDVEAI
jgi:ribosomal-protein-alanine N-acetyltransferase